MSGRLMRLFRRTLAKASSAAAHPIRDAIAGALDANRTLTAQRLAVVDVYRALGGGWK
jgi:hypothetical protein